MLFLCSLSFNSRHRTAQILCWANQIQVFNLRFCFHHTIWPIIFLVLWAYQNPHAQYSVRSYKKEKSMQSPPEPVCLIQYQLWSSSTKSDISERSIQMPTNKNFNVLVSETYLMQTLCLAVGVGTACSMVAPLVLFQALALTSAIVLGLTGYAFHASRNGKDFTFMGPALTASMAFQPTLSSLEPPFSCLIVFEKLDKCITCKNNSNALHLRQVILCFNT